MHKQKYIVNKFIVLFAIFYVGLECKVCSKSDSICRTEYCRNVSESIAKEINENIDRCDDFYGYVCSNYEKNTQIAEDMVAASLFTKLNDRVQNQLKQILELKILDDDIEPIKLMKRIFQSCIDIYKLNQLGLSPLRKILPGIVDWPFQNENFEDFDWKQELIHYRRNGEIYHFIIKVSDELDLNNTTLKIITIGEPSLSIDKEYLMEGFENDNVKALYDFMVNITLLFNNKTTKNESIKEIILFEIELAKIIQGNGDMNNNIMTINEIEKKKYKLFEPSGFFDLIQKLIIDENDPDMGRILNLSRNRTINNQVPEYLGKLDKLLQDTPKRMPYALNSAYARMFFDVESKNNVQEIVNNIKSNFAKTIQNLSWLDAEGKIVALKKLNAMKSMVGYPEQLLNDTEIIKEYEDYNEIWNDDELYQSIQMIRKLETTKRWKQLYVPIDRNDWRYFADVAVINAYYSQPINIIILPAAILQKEVFDKEMPPAMNYGRIGTIVSHEITHGFDSEGSQFDELNNLRNWWTPKTKDLFEAKKNAIAQQYSKYIEPITGKKLNGNRTLNENIADNGGALLAFSTFQEYDRSNKSLIDSKFNSNQLFWISYARLWCFAVKEKALANQIDTSERSPSRFRINGPLQNSVDFSNDFQCSHKSWMNPTQKNIVWG